MKKLSLFFIAALFAISFTSCEEDEIAILHDVTFVNNFYTDATITVNEITKSLPEDGQVTFEIIDGGIIDYNISTKGENGLTISWIADASSPIKAVERITYDINVPSEFFFLAIKHNKPNKADITEVVVNYTDATNESTETVSYPLSIYLHMVGYYKAFTNTKIRVKAGTVTDYWMNGSDKDWGFTFAMQANQAVTLQTEDLAVLKKKARVANTPLPGLVIAK